MNIYLISQDINCGYDTYDSCVVIAESEDDARTVHPSEFVTHVTNGQFMGTYEKGGEYPIGESDWIAFSDTHKAKVELIGTTVETEKRCVLASFNAG